MKSKFFLAKKYDKIVVKRENMGNVDPVSRTINKKVLKFE